MSSSQQRRVRRVQTYISEEALEVLTVIAKRRRISPYKLIQIWIEESAEVIAGIQRRKPLERTSQPEELPLPRTQANAEDELFKSMLFELVKTPKPKKPKKLVETRRGKTAEL